MSNSSGTRIYFELLDVSFPVHKPCLENSLHKSQIGIAFLITFYVLLVVLTGVPNLVIFIGYWSYKTTLTNIACIRYIMCIMVPSDFIVGFFAVWGIAALEICNWAWPLPKFMCDVWYFFLLLGWNVSKWSVCVVAIDRCLAISFPLQYRKLDQAFCQWFVIGFVWIFHTLFSAAVFVIWPHAIGFREAEPDNVCLLPSFYHVEVSLLQRILNWYIPFSLTIISYIILLICAFKSIKFSSQFAANGQVNVAQNLIRMKKTLRITSIIVGLYTIFWMPSQVIEILNVLRIRIPIYDYFNIYFFFYICTIFNSTLNPVAYVFMDKSIRKMALNLMTCGYYERYQFNRAQNSDLNQRCQRSKESCKKLNCSSEC